MKKTIDQLSPEAHVRLECLLRLGSAAPYIIERMQEEYDIDLAMGSSALKKYAEERNIPWLSRAALRYPVAAILDPERPWREMFREMVAQRKTYNAMSVALRNAGAPLSHDGSKSIMSAIASTGWEYKPHGPGGSWGRSKPEYGNCPRCGEPIAIYDRVYCNIICAKAARKEKKKQ